MDRGAWRGLEGYCPVTESDVVFKLEVIGLELGNDGDNERKGWMWKTL